MSFMKDSGKQLADKVLYGDKEAIIDAIGSDPAALHERGGLAGRFLVNALNKAVAMQSGAIVQYVNWLRSREPEATPAQLQKSLDTHFMRLATGSGAGAGAGAAIPGIGFLTGALTIGAESLVFLDAAAFYTVASAYIREADIHDPERRKALILVAITGAEGSALVDVTLGATSSVAAISRMNSSNLVQVNSQLVKIAMKQLNKRIRRAWIGKILPMGVGLVLGTMANRKLANKVIENTKTSLGALPATFSTPAPVRGSVKEPKLTEDGKKGSFIKRGLKRAKSVRDTDVEAAIEE